MTAKPATADEPDAAPAAASLVDQYVLAACEGDLATIRDLVAHHPPESFEAIAIDGTSPVAALSYDDARRDPSLLLLRAVARLHNRTETNDEAVAEIREALHAFSERNVWSWAGYAGRWYHLVCVYQCETGEISAGPSVRLLNEYPDLGRDAIFVAAVAETAMYAGEEEWCNRLWDAARKQASAGTADQYWVVQLLHARMTLTTHPRELADVARVLERARSHFRGREDTWAKRQLHDCCMAHASLLLAAGRPQGVLDVISVDIDEMEPDGEYRSYLEAFRACAAVHSGEMETAQSALKMVKLGRDAFIGLELAVLGPARLGLIASSATAIDVKSHLDHLLQTEGGSSVAPLFSAMWRIQCAELLLKRGDIRAWTWLVDEAIELANENNLATLELQARVLQLCMIKDISALKEDERAQNASAVLELCDDVFSWETVAKRPEALAVVLSIAGTSSHAGTLRRIAAVADRDCFESALELCGKLEAGGESLEQILIGTGITISDRDHRSDGVNYELFGGLRVTADIGEVDEDRWYGRKKARLLLARLLMEPGRPISVRDLHADIWGTVSKFERSASKRIAPLTYNVRNALRPVLQRDPNDVLETTNGGYALNLGPDDRCDLIDFRRLAAEALNAVDSSDVERAGNAALVLYSGELVAGTDSLPWIVNARQEVRHTYAAIVQHMLATNSQFAVSEHVVAQLERAQSADPTDESICDALVSLAAHLGITSVATRAFHETRVALRDELGMAPSERLIRVHRQVLSPLSKA